MTSVYEPREDSQLLATQVRLYARGRVLDMGTGSGIQALAAKENKTVTDVLAVDVNKAAVDRVAKLGIAAKKSDMFKELKGEVFDTIICNPPYLPDEEKDHDPALYGKRASCAARPDTLSLLQPHQS
jgi:release factor glutamine methyltransferase